jgi:hypothetical protein
MSISEADARAEGRREAAPAAVVALLVFVLLAVVSRAEKWELLGLPWWTWLLVALPVLLLAIDLVMTYRGSGLVRSRMAALLLLGLLVVGNFTALAILVIGLVTENTSNLTGGELLLTAFAIWSSDVIAFGLLLFWEIEAGGPVKRMLDPSRTRTGLSVSTRRRGAACERLASAGLGLRLRLADECDCIQPDRHDAAFTAREGDDGPRVGHLRGHRLARRRPRGERTRLIKRTRPGRAQSEAARFLAPTTTRSR